MYLVFDRNTKELINYLESSDYSVINRNKYNIVYFDKYTVIIKRDEVDFIETYFDEQSQLNVIVSGQHTLSNAINDFLELFQYANEVREKGNKLMKEILNGKVEVIPLSYIIYIGQLSLKEQLEYTRVEMELDFDREQSKELFHESIRLCDNINYFGGIFMKDIENAKTKSDIDKAFDNLKKDLE